MVEMDIKYEGQLRCVALHGPSGNVISTDAPKDNQGRGEAFSPTDLVAAALGTCMLTLAGIYAQRHNLDITGASAHVTKEMVAAPIRRIGKLNVSITLPNTVPEEHRQLMEKAANSCPVSQSLHPDIEKIVKYIYSGATTKLPH